MDIEKCTNRGKYVDKNHKCYLKKVKTKGGNCTFDIKNPCRLNKSIKRKIGVSRVDPTQKNTYFTILNVLRIPVLMNLT